ncbi:MAG TPA: ATP-binding protein [Firmicutes bacterium]|nr:ATP-binding protein [Bacillota bacterium]
MIKLIVGEKGTGKTKILLDSMHEAVKKTNGNVVCIDKGSKLTYDLDYNVRLINLEEYQVSGFEAFYGFVAGLLAGNYDITDIFVDSILKVVGRDYEKLGQFFNSLDLIAKDVNLIFTVSADRQVLPESVQQYII